MDDTDPARQRLLRRQHRRQRPRHVQQLRGPGLEVVIEQREEGGNNGFVWQLPTRMKYTNVKLTRPVGEDTAKITKWFASMVNGVTPTTATIAAMTRRRQGRRAPGRWTASSRCAGPARA